MDVKCEPPHCSLEDTCKTLPFPDTNIPTKARFFAAKGLSWASVVVVRAGRLKGGNCGAAEGAKVDRVAQCSMMGMDRREVKQKV